MTCGLIEWHPFQLNPEMPQGGMDRREYLEAKFGGKENAIRVYSKIADAAEAAGLTINFDRIERTPNTVDAHRLIHWAGLEGRQAAIIARMFKAYFENGQNIGDREVLLDMAEGAGLDREMTARLFDGDADLEDIRARDRHARNRGVTGVPTFVVANQHVVPGAQPPELWIRVIDELTEQAQRTEA